jgi:AcrR family transcriptional regulator
MDRPAGGATSGGTRERILDAAEALLRRHGPAKTAVVDVAKALGMSHGNVYRHFASRAELLDAVAERWLRGVSGPLAGIAAGPEPAAARLEAWVLALAAAKRRKVLDDPELFATYHAVAEAARHVVEAHLAELRGQLARIVREGAAAGEFRVADPDAAAAAVLDATVRFHHPRHVMAAGDRSAAPRADAEADLRRVLALLLAGLRAGGAGV